MSNTYRIHGARYLRKYTAAEKSSNYAYMADVRKIANSLCAVPWSRVAMDIPATNTIHNEEGLDWNEPERDRFDAAEWCGEHSDGFHRAFAQAACYVFKLPTTAIGKTIQKIGVNVTSDPYNPYGARIAALTSATLNIPMDCDTVRTGDVFRAPDSDGLGAAPRLFRNNADGTQTWYANSEIVELVPGATLAAKQYLFVFVCLENYNRGRDGWIEGSSYIDNDIALTLSSAASDLDANELNDLTPPVVLSEFNVCRGGVLPNIVGDVSGVRTALVSDSGNFIVPGNLDSEEGSVGTDAMKSIGLRSVYAALYRGSMASVPVANVGVARPGVSFSVRKKTARGNAIVQNQDVFELNQNYVGKYWMLAFGGSRFIASRDDGTGIYVSDDYGLTWSHSNKATGIFSGAAYGNGVFVAAEYNTGHTGCLWYSEDGGMTWNKCEDVSGECYSISYGDGHFVAAFLRINNSVVYSENGKDWNNSATGGAIISYVGYGDGIFIGTGTGSNQGKIYRSTNGGISWSVVSGVSLSGLGCGIAYGDGVFVVSRGNSGGVYRSVNGGLSWTKVLSNDSYEDVVFCDGAFVVGHMFDNESNSGVWYSIDGGSNWIRSNIRTTNRARIAAGGGVIVAGSDTYNEGSSQPLAIGYVDRMFPSKEAFQITTSVLLVPFSIPTAYKAVKMRLDWNGYAGTNTSGKYNVWIARGVFANEYPADVIANPKIYDATEKKVGAYELVGTVDASSASKTATFDFGVPLDGYVATVMLTAFASLDNANPGSGLSFPVGVATGADVHPVSNDVSGFDSAWKPDITLLG